MILTIWLQFRGFFPSILYNCSDIYYVYYLAPLDFDVLIKTQIHNKCHQNTKHWYFKTYLVFFER